MTYLDKLLAKAPDVEKMIATAKMQDALVIAVDDILPVGLKWQPFCDEQKRVWETSYTADFTAYLEAENLNVAIAALSTLLTHKLFMCEDGWTTIRPEPKAVHRQDRDTIKRTELAANYMLEVEGLRGHRTTSTLRAFITLLDKVVELHIELKSCEGAYRTYQVEEYMGGLRVYNVKAVNNTKHFDRSIVYVAGSNEHPGKVVFYQKEMKDDDSART